jgi:hypothetical protein
VGDEKREKRLEMILRSPELLWDIFMKMVCDTRIKPLHCVLDGLDGLDECSEETQRFIAKRARELLYVDDSNSAGTPTSRLRLIIVSRGTVGGLHKLLHISLDSDHEKHISADVERYIKHEVGQLTAEGLDEES